MAEEKSFKGIYAETLKKMDDLTDKQKQVLSVALELFSTQGFDATSSAQIAEQAGVSLGSVYHHFPNKQALLMGVLTPLFEGVFQVASSEFVTKVQNSQYVTLEEFVQFILSDRIKFLHDNFKEVKIMAGQVLISSELSVQIKNIFADRFNSSVSPVIDILKKNKLIVDLPNNVILECIMGPIATYFDKLALNIQIKSIDEDISNAITFVTKALKP